MSEKRSARVGVDIGGTFTDLVLVDDTAGRMYSSKVLTTPENPANAVLHGIGKLLTESEVVPSEVMNVVHGTTLATNAIIERKGAKTALLTTKGFRDVLETARELRYDLYDTSIEFPKPLVPRRHRVGVSERTRYDGQILESLDQQEIGEVIERLETSGITSLAVCFLHSYANPMNERSARSLIKALAPKIRVSLSSDVLPEVGEYGRVSTTVANAYVQPLIEEYLDEIVRSLTERGIRSGFYVMGSTGGALSVEMAKQFPVKLVESGPAAGVSVASYFAQLGQRPNTLALDMGGTTAKICVIEGGQPTMTTEFEVARVRRFQKGSGLLLKVPAVDLMEIGAGGGSIAKVNELGLLAVGPESAGAAPGPACYARGGKDATVTDADLVLGYLNPDFFLGGEMRLDAAEAKTAIDRSVGLPLEMDTVEAALSIHQIVNENMANAAAVYAAEKGIDLRDFTLFAFGGAAPAHACDVARRLGIRSVVVPFAAGVLSALGCLVSPLAFDFVIGYMSQLRKVDWSRVNKTFDELETRGRQLLTDGGIASGITVTRAADMRYLGQRYEVTVVLPSSGPLAPAQLDEISTLFYETYRRQFGREIREVPIETVQWRLTVSGPRPSVRIEQDNDGDGRQTRASTPKGRRNVFLTESNAYVDCPVYDRYALKHGEGHRGPAVIEDRESTTIVPVASSFVTDDLRHLVITLDSVGGTSGGTT